MIKTILRRNLVLIFFILLGVACSNDDKVERAKLDTDVDAILNATDPACGIVGYASAKPGETLVYEYVTNIKDPVISWDLEGEIAIIRGQGTQRITLLFGDFFNGGKISVFAKSSSGNCSVSEVIRLE